MTNMIKKLIEEAWTFNITILNRKLTINLMILFINNRLPSKLQLI